jgi:hypothetical protein
MFCLFCVLWCVCRQRPRYAGAWCKEGAGTGFQALNTHAQNTHTGIDASAAWCKIGDNLNPFYPMHTDRS